MSLKDDNEEKLDKWKDMHINIAVTGESGSGKSTLINSIRGLYPNDPYAAATSINEIPNPYPNPYPFPNNDKIILWDVPGVNTPNFPLKNYLDDINYIYKEDGTKC